MQARSKWLSTKIVDKSQTETAHNLVSPEFSSGFTLCTKIEQGESPDNSAAF
jgi:ABC-type molybdate transport system substrate-binding protein